jgi:hypothetical protein
MVNNAIFSLISFYLLGCSFFWIDFAKLHITLPIVHVPLFIGELTLAVCLVLLAAEYKSRPFKMALWPLLAVYLAWVLVKAVAGFSSSGAYGLRNAAMFYYPLFGLISYFSFKVEIFKNRILHAVLLAVLILAKLTGHFNGYYLYVYFALMLTLALSLPQWKYKWLGIALLVLLFPFQSFYQDSKNIVAAHVCAVIFLFVAYYNLQSKKFSWVWRLAAPLLFLIVIGVGFLAFSGSNKLKILSKPEMIINLFIEYDKLIKERRPYYNQDTMRPKSYHQVKDGETSAHVDNAYAAIEYKLDHMVQAEVIDQVKNKVKGRPVAEINAAHKEVLMKMKANPHPTNQQKMELIEEARSLLKERDSSFVMERGRDLGTDYTNIMFRLLIWRDMLKELWEQKPIFGFSFGKPQRSISLEVLNIAVGEWSRDGWIMPHNSYLHFIYRGGLIGLTLVVILVWSFFHLSKLFFQKRSLVGVILMSVVVYWLTIANFTVFFEFPYQAIAFWSVLGFLFAYKQYLMQKVVQ